MKDRKPDETIKLAEAEAPLTRALSALLECAREHRAFVIVEDTITGRYVQFSGSSAEPLWFDAPQLGIKNSGPKFTDPGEAARYALSQLRGPHRLPDGALLRFVFDSTLKNEPS